MNQYWLTFNPDVFIWKKHNLVLIYNAINYTVHEFESCKKFDDLYKTLVQPENLYTSTISDKDLQDKDFSTIVKQLLNANCLSLTPVSENAEIPVSFFPMPGIQRSRDKFRTNQGTFDYEKYSFYLQEITVYINGKGIQSNLYAKQFPYFLEDGKELNYQDLELLLKTIAHSSISNIRICGSNIFKYSNLYRLLNNLDRIHAIKSLYVSCQQILDFGEAYKLLSSEQFEYRIIVDSLHPLLESVVSMVQKKKLNITWIFYVASKNEYTSVLEQISRLQLEKYSIKPIFRGNNLSFFFTHVFMTKEDVITSQLNKRQIFANQILNTNDFGKFTISSNGDVFVNVNFPSCGNIKNDTIYTLIQQELVWGKLWFRTRTEHPCSECLYQWLCPSPSNYEIVLNQPNLCFKHINKQQFDHD